MDRKYALAPAIVAQIAAFARQCGLEKVILFGSRARGDNRERSDIDLAVSGGQVARFSIDLNETDAVRTLLMFDVVSLDDPVSDKLQAEIARDGILLYAKAG
ncbi:nucleotidyltransferase domain-containing protein [bacterium]|nr:nucleotidyltransferase domain-containing protein [bacterium]